MSSKVLIDTQSPFRKSHTASRSSGSKTQRDASSSGNSVNFFGHNMQQASNGSNEGTINIAQQGYPQNQQPLQAGTLYQQQLRTARNNSENRHSTTSISGNASNNINPPSSSAINTTSSASIKTSQILRNNSNFSATPQKKKDQISMYIIESGGSKISHTTSLNHNYSQNPYSNSKLSGSQQISNGSNGTSSSGIKQQSSQSASSSSQKYLNQNSIFTNNFAKENVGISMHKHSTSSSLMGTAKINNSSLNGGNLQSMNVCNNSINNNNNSAINTNLTNSGNNQNVFYQIQNQNNSNSNNNQNTSASLSPNQKTLYQNILNSSWKVNMIPNQTPRKGGDSCTNGSIVNNNSSGAQTTNGSSLINQSSSNNSNSKILSSSSRSYSKTQARQQPYIQDNNYQIITNTSGKATGQNLSPLNSSSVHNGNPISSRLNTSTSSSSNRQQSDEIKRLKMEIEQYKNREIKYLVRIATLEKETKKLSESLEKQESINKDITMENSKMRRMNSFNNTSINQSYCGNSADKNMIANHLGNNSNLTSSIDELSRSVRQQKGDIQDSTPSNSNSQSNPLNSGNCCQCGLNASSNSYGVNSGNKQGASSLSSQNSASYNKYKLKYTQLRNQHKEILKRCIDTEKENREIKSESQMMKQLYIEKMTSKNMTPQQSDSNSLSNGSFIQQNSSNQSAASTLQNLESNQLEKIPSFLKVLSIGQNICN